MDPKLLTLTQKISDQLISLDRLLPEDGNLQAFTELPIEKLQSETDKLVDVTQQMLAVYHGVAMKNGGSERDVNRYITYSKESYFAFATHPITVQTVAPVFLYWIYTSHILRDVLTEPVILPAPKAERSCGIEESDELLQQRPLLASAGVKKRKTAPAATGTRMTRAQAQKELEAMKVLSPDQLETVQKIVQDMLETANISQPTEDVAAQPSKRVTRKMTVLSRDPVAYFDVVAQGLLVLPFVMRKTLKLVFEKMEEIPLLQGMFGVASIIGGTGWLDLIMASIQALLTKLRPSLPDTENIETYTKSMALMTFFAAIIWAIYIHYTEGLPALAFTISKALSSTLMVTQQLEQDILDTITGSTDFFITVVANMRANLGADDISLFDTVVTYTTWGLMFSTKAVVLTAGRGLEVVNGPAFEGVKMIIDQASLSFFKLGQVLQRSSPVGSIVTQFISGFFEANRMMEYLVLIPNFLRLSTIISLVQKVALKLLNIMRSGLQHIAQKVPSLSGLISVAVGIIDAVIVATITVPFSIKVFLAFSIFWSMLWKFGMFLMNAAFTS